VRERPILGQLKTIRLPLLATLAIQTLVTGTALVPPVIAPVIAPDLAVPESAAGAWIALVYLGAVTSSLFVGGLIRRLGAMTASLLSLVLAGSGLAILAGGHVALGVLGALVSGLGYGITTPASSEILARNTPSAIRGLVFSIKQTGVPLGGVLAGAAIPTLTLALGWPAAVGLAGVAALLLAAMLLPLRHGLDARRPDEPPPAGPSGLAVVRGHRRLHLVALASFGFSAVQLCVTSYLVIHLVRSGGMALVTAGLVFATAQIAGALGRILWGHIADRTGNAGATLMVLALATAVLLLAIGQLTPAWPSALAVLAAVAIGATSLAWNGVFLAEVAHLAPAGQAGAATGGALVFTYAGVVVGPPGFALLLWLGWGYAGAFAAAALLILAAAGLIHRAR